LVLLRLVVVEVEGGHTAVGLLSPLSATDDDSRGPWAGVRHGRDVVHGEGWKILWLRGVAIGGDRSAAGSSG